MKISKISILVILAFCGIKAEYAFAQQNQAQTPVGETSKPIELPAFIIEGVEQLDYKSGVKQAPSKSSPLSQKELDSLNSLEKQQAAMLPPEQLPNKTFDKNFSKGFLKAGFGLFVTPELEAGYGVNLGGYELYANGGFESSGGSAKRSDYSKMFLSLYSDFIAPDKFFIFGGSRTRTNVFFNNSTFNLFGDALSQDKDGYTDRSMNKYGFAVDVDGNFENIQFATGGQIKSLQLSTDSKALSYYAKENAFQNQVNGYLSLRSNWSNYLVAANISIDLGSVRTNSVNFLQLDASASYFNNEFSIVGKAGFQAASNSDEDSRGGLLLGAELHYRMSSLFTVNAAFFSGLVKTSLFNYFEKNPYLDFSSKVDFPYDITNVSGFITYHPLESMQFSAGARWRLTDRMNYFSTDSTNTSTVKYNKGTSFEIILDGIWSPTDKDRFIFNLTTNASVLNDYDGSIPYMPAMMVSADYRREWLENFGTQIGLVYVGERKYNENIDENLDSYISLKLSADYRLNKEFLFYAKFDNLTNSNTYIWKNYKERGLFASIGLMWQF